MPIFEYQAVTDGCAHCAQGFDHLQRLSDETLVTCPKCGAAVRQLISAPSVVSGGGHHLKEKHFSERGFTQYRKIGKGVYEKTAGKGPGIIKGD